MRRLAVFASGSGTNFEAIVRACEQGVLDAEVVLMVCDKPGAKVVERAAEHGVEAFVFAPKEYASKAAYEREIVARLDAAGVELVCLAGYMRIIGDELLGAYGGRIINIHPSLLPAFRGAHAIEQALEYGVKVFDPLCRFRTRRRAYHRPAGLPLRGQRYRGAGTDDSRRGISVIH